jgi:hypothetical protein
MATFAGTEIKAIVAAVHIRTFSHANRSSLLQR